MKKVKVGSSPAPGILAIRFHLDDGTTLYGFLSTGWIFNWKLKRLIKKMARTEELLSSLPKDDK